MNNNKSVGNRDTQDAHFPESRGDIQMSDDQVIDRLLEALPDVPVSTNFTSQIIQAVQRERAVRKSRSGRSWGRLFGSFSWGWQMASVSFVAVLAYCTHYQYRVLVREEVARSVAAVGHLASLPTVDMLENFEVIRRMDVAPEQADMELLAALQ